MKKQALIPYRFIFEIQMANKFTDMITTTMELSL